MFFLALTSADGGRPNANSSPPFAAACRVGRALLGRHVNGVLVAPKSGCRGAWCYSSKKLEHDGGGTVLSMYDMTTTNHTQYQHQPDHPPFDLLGRNRRVLLLDVPLLHKSSVRSKMYVIKIDEKGEKGSLFCDSR